ncbi:MAG: hypothetical protein FIA97_06625 [Methylococcaceae bacterium]|nr:hypothetical protein [Methylococcaceae bacterium]
MLLVFSLGTMPAQADSDQRPEPVSAWELSIAIPDGEGERALSLDPAAHFHVILSNRAGVVQKAWKESNSWGYAALRFELTTPSGDKFVVTRKERSWRKNIPSFWSLNAGENLVYNVFLGSAEWAGLPPNPQGKHLTIRAIVEIPDEEKSREYGVWTGKVQSPPRDVVIR